MSFKKRNVRALAEMVVGDAPHFHYRSSYYITQFFEDCDLEHFRHDGSTRWSWTADRLAELLAEPQANPGALPEGFVRVVRRMMDPLEAQAEDPDRTKALASLNLVLMTEGYEAYVADDGRLYLRHNATQVVSGSLADPHRPLTAEERNKRSQLVAFLDHCSEDALIEDVLLPLFRQLGFQRVTAVGHKDKAMEYGKDVWMRFKLPTQHVLYFGIQAKKGKIDAAGASKGSNTNVAEILNQVKMMLGHVIFDPETSKRTLVDHGFIIAGGEITKQARNWLGERLDASQRSQIMFMDRDDILDLYIVANIPLPSAVDKPSDASVDDFDPDVPF